MKTIVALVDLSDLTFKVLKHAHALASAFNSEVIIVHVLGKAPVVVDLGIASPVLSEDPPETVAEEQVEQLLEIRDSLIKFGVRASVVQLADPKVASVLAETKRLNADLIILGSHHHSTIYHMLVGSVANDVLKRAHCPVLVVPSDEDAAA
ncbi:universal stress protein [Prosthecobacter sp.]|uniref:universal stress protein n=1 Tax=Prosthecobacter sp. TaxID=1965333 RepID=UPI0037850CB3